MNATNLIRRLFEHLRWANHRLLAACQPLTPEQLVQPLPIGQGTILATLVHLYAAEFVWLAAIEGNPNPISPFDIRFNTLSELTAAWKDLDARWDRFFSALTDADLERHIAKKSTSSYAGTTRATPLSDILLHLPIHAQYTSAQLKNMLRTLGISPLPDIMLITLSRDQAK